MGSIYMKEMRYLNIYLVTKSKGGNTHTHIFRINIENAEWHGTMSIPQLQGPIKSQQMQMVARIA